MFSCHSRRMHLNILGKRKNQQGENERCGVCVCVCVCLCVCVCIFFPPPHHFDLAVVIPPNVSVGIFTHVPTHFVRERREGGFGRRRKTSAFDGSQSATLFRSCELGRGEQFEVTGQIAPLQLTKRKKKMALQASAKERGEVSFFIILKFVDSRCVPDLTFLSLSFLFSLPSYGRVPAFQSERVLTSSSGI